MSYVAFLRGKKVVEANDFMTVVNEPVAHVRAKEASTACYKNPLKLGHDLQPIEGLNAGLIRFC